MSGRAARSQRGAARRQARGSAASDLTHAAGRALPQHSVSPDLHPITQAPNTDSALSHALARIYRPAATSFGDLSEEKRLRLTEQLERKWHGG